MPKIAILSDIHANLPALKAVLRDVASSCAESVVFGGDLVGYGASPRECVDLVRKLGSPCVIGNHDFYTRTISEAGTDNLPSGWQQNPVWAGVVHAIEELENEALQWLWSRPVSIPLPGDAILAHASLDYPEDWNYLLNDDSATPTLKILRQRELGIGFFGHTHQQEIFIDETADDIPRPLEDHLIHIPENAVCAVTVGSVGQPRSRNDLRANWVIWDPEERIVEFRRTEYPAMDAAMSILLRGLPAHSALRLLPDEQAYALLGLNVPGQESVGFEDDLEV